MGVSSINRTPAIAISVPLVVTAASAYASGQQLGSLVKLPNALPESKGSAIVRSISIIDKSKQNVSIDLFFFSDLPTITSVDHAAADVSASEMALKCIGHLNMPTNSYASLANCSEATLSFQGMMINGSHLNVKDVWMLAVVRGTPTYATTDALTVKVSMQQN